MKRHGHDNVCGEIFGLRLNQIGEPVRKPGTKRLNLFVFQEENRTRECPFVETIAACELKREPVLLAIPAKGRNLGKFRVKCAGLSAERAASGWDLLEGGEAIVAKRKTAGVRQELIAETAARGEKHRGKRAGEILQPMAATSEEEEQA